MKWFKHDSSASMDARIRKLVLRYGPEGYAVYFHCLELISGNVTNEKITFELEHDAEIIAHNLNFQSDNDFTAIDKVNNIMKCIIGLRLFEEDANQDIFCFKLAKRIDSSLIKNPELNNIKKQISGKLEKIREGSRKVIADKHRLDENREDNTIADKSATKPKKQSLLSEQEKEIYKEMGNYFGEKYQSLKGEKLIRLFPAEAKQFHEKLNTQYSIDEIKRRIDNYFTMNKYCEENKPEDLKYWPLKILTFIKRIQDTDVMRAKEILTTQPLSQIHDYDPMAAGEIY